MRCSSVCVCVCVCIANGRGRGRQQAARCTAWGHAFRTKHELFAHLRGPRLPPLLPVPSSETTDKINYVLFDFDAAGDVCTHSHTHTHLYSLLSTMGWAASSLGKQPTKEDSTFVLRQRKHHRCWWWLKSCGILIAVQQQQSVEEWCCIDAHWDWDTSPFFPTDPIRA